jgi:hypothetical protein
MAAATEEDAVDEVAGADEAVLAGLQAARENMSEPAAATPRKVLMDVRMGVLLGSGSVGVPVPAAVVRPDISSGSGLVCQEYFESSYPPGWVTTEPTPTRYTTRPGFLWLSRF